MIFPGIAIRSRYDPIGGMIQERGPRGAPRKDPRGIPKGILGFKVGMKERAARSAPRKVFRDILKGIRIDQCTKMKERGARSAAG